MKRTLILISVVVIALLVIADVAFAGHLAKPRREGGILYKLKQDAPEANKAAARAILQSYGATVQRSLRRINVDQDRLQAKQGKTEEEICNELKNTGAVEFAEPDYLIPPDITPNDPNYNSQWFHPKIGSPAAWDITTGSDAIITSVCDTGTESTHPDLAVNLLLPGYNSVDDSTNTDPVHPHGTATAGCIGAVGNNGVGVSGMNWNVKVLPVRVSNEPEGWAYYSDLAEGVTWASDHGARVVNVSYGVGGSSTFDSAATYARNNGTLVFASAGNEGTQVNYPDYSSFVLVGATNSSDALTSWSNYGTAVDIVAPGENIYIPYTGGGYAYWSGTSFSSPISAGVAALIFALDPSFTPAEVENFIFTTCTDLGVQGDDIVYGKGRINAAAAVQAASAYVGNTPPVAVLSASSTSGVVPFKVDFNGSGSYDTDGTISSYTWTFGDGGTGTGVTASHTYQSSGNFTARLTVTDNKGASASDTEAITVTPGANTINAPSNLAATVLSRRVTLNWTDNSNNEQGFYIERAPLVRNRYNYKNIATVGQNVTSYSQSVSRGTYRYRLRAYNRTMGKTSAYSNEAEAIVR